MTFKIVKAYTKSSKVLYLSEAGKRFENVDAIDAYKIQSNKETIDDHLVLLEEIYYAMEGYNNGHTDTISEIRLVNAVVEELGYSKLFPCSWSFK